MSTSHARTRLIAAPLLVGLLAMVGASCGAPPPPYQGIRFNPPAVGYVGKTYTPTADSTSGLPVTLALDASSTACTFVGGVLSFVSVGNCVINANQPGDATHPADPQVQATIRVYECPPLRSGTWTEPNYGLSAQVNVTGTLFTGTFDASAFGYPLQYFSGSVNCDAVTMLFNTTTLRGTLSYDGSSLAGSYEGIAITLIAPPSPN